MKYLFMILGLAFAWATYYWLPTAFAELVKVSGFPAGVAAIGTLLTAGWIVCLSKLSVFEKLEELPTTGRDNVMKYARIIRQRVIGTIIANCIFATVAIVGTFAAQLGALAPLHITEWFGYVLVGALGFWLGGTVDSWSCYSSIEATREELLVAQIEAKKRTAYLAKLRADTLASPIPRNDSHLNGYTADF